MDKDAKIKFAMDNLNSSYLAFITKILRRDVKGALERDVKGALERGVQLQRDNGRGYQGSYGNGNKMKAIVLLSGGQDSATSLAWACNQFGPEEILALSIFYGQRHKSELEAARVIAQWAGVKHSEVGIDSYGEAMAKVSALTGDGELKGSGGYQDLPTSFVPARNALFLTIAAGFAARENCNDIVTGVCQTDYSGYPDCREVFIKAMETALSLGLFRTIRIHTPLMFQTKAETVKMMKRFGKLWWLEVSVTCYKGERPPCKECPACVLRAKGFAEAGIEDPALLPAMVPHF